MRQPSAYSANEIKGWPTEEEFEPGKWRPARPCAFSFGILSWSGWKQRFRLAWRVFTGRSDVLYWGAQSGEFNNDAVKYRDITDPQFTKRK